MKHTLHIDDSSNTISNSFYTASIIPDNCSYGRGCESFNLTIKNNTEKDIELNWDKTYYIDNGITSGRFMYDGVKFEDRFSTNRSPDIIFPNERLSKNIWPSELSYFNRLKIRHKIMPLNNNGVYLSLIVNGKENKEKLTVSFSVTKEKY